MRKYIVFPAVVIFIMVAIGVAVWGKDARPAKSPDPWHNMPRKVTPTDHTYLVQGPFADGPAVTKACLGCHADSARQVMATSHWSWQGQKIYDHKSATYIDIGKKNQINNYCVGIQSNWPRCTSCHIGYGWRDDHFDFGKQENVDCLICHDTTGSYRKNPVDAGNPDPKVDLLAVAKKVGLPSRRNCGECHFAGGGGDAVKHGDLNGTMYFPSERLDVHMGKHDFQCIACHRAERHNIAGRIMPTVPNNAGRVECTDCHDNYPHRQERLNAHVQAVACQTCHIPHMAIGAATKMSWDWSTAGQDLQVEDPRTYDKKKGTFTFAKNVAPEYRWFNGWANRYLPGDKIDPQKVVEINAPRGDIRDAQARIWPFKIHRGKQVYDKEHLHLLVPKTFGKGGYWSDFDWDKALRLGSEASKLAYSGKFDFVATEMYWPLNHTVASKDKALSCTDCHGDSGRMPWAELGYDGDPAFYSSHRHVGLNSKQKE